MKNIMKKKYLSAKKYLISALATMILSTLYVTSVQADAGWSPRTSEEYPPITVSNLHLINAFFCSGKYCDNLYIRKAHTNRQFGTNYWTSYFSEEKSNFRTCAGNSFMTGLSCKGRFCDDISIQCTTIPKAFKNHCAWTPYFSEEIGFRSLPSGKYAAGMRCKGGFCDNKSILACHIH